MRILRLLIRLPPEPFLVTAPYIAGFEIVFVSWSVELVGPGVLLHGTGAAAEFGAPGGGQEGDQEGEFAEEGLDYWLGGVLV